MANQGPRYRGWLWDGPNALLKALRNGTERYRLTSRGVEVVSPALFVPPIVAEDATTGGIPMILTVALAATSTSANEDITVADTIRVIDAHAVTTGGAGNASDTITVANGSDNITDAMSWSGVDKAVVRAGTIDDAFHRIASGGTLRVKVSANSSSSSTATGKAYVQVIKVS